MMMRKFAKAFALLAFYFSLTNGVKLPASHSQLFLHVPRGGAITTSIASTPGVLTESLTGLMGFLKGRKADSLILLAVTALTTPACQKILKISPILGYLSLGLLLGPNGFGSIADAHATEHVADFGIVLFLFEMGIHLDLKTLWDIRTDVFGVGMAQFTSTAIAIAGFCHWALDLSVASSIIIGWSLALSSSAFVLQLLKDKKQTETKYGKSSFGALLLQDLMVVPLLVMTPLLAGGAGGVGKAVSKALASILLTLVAIVGVFGQGILKPALNSIVNNGSKEALIGFLLASVFGGSFLTEGLGLSNTLGAFLMGMLMAETDHKHLIEEEISLFRGVLVGIFFFTVGFEIDLNLILSQPLLVAGIVLAIMGVKVALATFSCLQFGIPLPIAQRIGFVLSQGGEFAFVAFRTARAAGILTKDQTRLLLTCVSLTMACTPAVEELGATLQKRLEEPEVKLKRA